MKKTWQVVRKASLRIIFRLLINCTLRGRLFKKAPRMRLLLTYGGDKAKNLKKPSVEDWERRKGLSEPTLILMNRMDIKRVEEEEEGDKVGEVYEGEVKHTSIERYEPISSFFVFLHSECLFLSIFYTEPIHGRCTVHGVWQMYSPVYDLGLLRHGFSEGEQSENGKEGRKSRACSDLATLLSSVNRTDRRKPLPKQTLSVNW